jgi:hypothetical protein
MKDELEEQAGEPGRDLAKAIATKIVETIDGYPAPPATRGAIARLVALELARYELELGSRGA